MNSFSAAIKDYRSLWWVSWFTWALRVDILPGICTVGVSEALPTWDLWRLLCLLSGCCGIASCNWRLLEVWWDISVCLLFVHMPCFYQQSVAAPPPPFSACPFPSPSSLLPPRIPLWAGIHWMPVPLNTVIEPLSVCPGIYPTAVEHSRQQLHSSRKQIKN